MSTTHPAQAVKVFLADDSAAIRSRIAELLAPGGVVVGESGTPQGCIDGILATRPDVVVLDVQLEGGAGLEVLQAIHAARPHVAFVVFTNNSQPGYRDRYFAAGAARFLDKSTEFDRLALAVRDSISP
jgi:two-component system response regulator DesR